MFITSLKKTWASKAPSKFCPDKNTNLGKHITIGREKGRKCQTLYLCLNLVKYYFLRHPMEFKKAKSK